KLCIRYPEYSAGGASRNVWWASIQLLHKLFGMMTIGCAAGYNLTSRNESVRMTFDENGRLVGMNNLTNQTTYFGSGPTSLLRVIRFSIRIKRLKYID
ncbi:MAG: hypothetical protein N2V75_06425, partial [Methanophagales archaeon]|nr:hypothetical protein [Methanophagales archaeon]